jgi:diacylglycerol kinase family enzyme
MKLLFVVNPISGGVDKEPFLKDAESMCNKYGIIYRVFKTSGKDDEAQLHKEIASFVPDKIASVGGDGTTLFTAVALLANPIPMGIIPLGSANGMAAELFVNLKPIDALKDLVLSDVVAGLDMLVVNDQYYTIHIGDVGVNAGIVNSYEKDKNRGMATYARYFIDELKKLDPFEVKIQAGNQTYEEKCFMLGICNARKFGTGVPLNTSGNPMDGKFELVLLQNIDINSLLKAGLAKFNEKFLDSNASKVIQAESVKIAFDQPRLLQLDGEVIGKFQHLKVNMLKGAVRLITHNNNKNLHV